MRSYVADYGDEDDDDYGIDTDGRYRLQRRRVSRGTRNEYDGEEVEEDEEEDEMEQDIDEEDDEEEDDEDEDNGRDYHRFGSSVLPGTAGFCCKLCRLCKCGCAGVNIVAEAARVTNKLT